MTYKDPYKYYFNSMDPVCNKVTSTVTIIIIIFYYYYTVIAHLVQVIHFCEVQWSHCPEGGSRTEG